MKALLPALLIATASSAFADNTTKPKRLVIGQGNQVALQGWTRLNGTADFVVSERATEAAPATQDASQEAARRARLQEAEAAYQKQKRKSKSGW